MVLISGLVALLSHIKVGKGRRSLFWHLWVGDVLLKDRFPVLFRISSDPPISVADAWDNIGSSWRLGTRSFLKDEEVVEITDLLSLLSSYSWVWSLETWGTFSVHSLNKYEDFSSNILEDVFSAIWNSNCPKRVNFLIWILLMGRLNTWEILQKKLPIPRWCSPRCVYPKAYFLLLLICGGLLEDVFVNV